MNIFSLLLPALIGEPSSFLNAMGKQELCASNHTGICDSQSIECESATHCDELLSSTPLPKAWSQFPFCETASWINTQPLMDIMQGVV
jgi:hypothetical protein